MASRIPFLARKCHLVSKNHRGHVTRGPKHARIHQLHPGNCYLIAIFSYNLRLSLAGENSLRRRTTATGIGTVPNILQTECKQPGKPAANCQVPVG